MTTDNKPDALEPCPFCGGSAWAFMEKRLWVIRHKPVGNCPIANHNPYEMVGYETKAEAIAAGFERHLLDPIASGIPNAFLGNNNN